jgi:predicted P-loop ATPase
MMQSQQSEGGNVPDLENNRNEAATALAESRATAGARKADETLAGVTQATVGHAVLDKAKPLNPSTFPHQPLQGSMVIPVTIPNVSHLLASYGITARYNTITKKVIITMPGQSGTPDNADNVALAQIISFATLNGLSAGQVPAYVYAIADRNQFNPIAAWILSKPWDGVDRLAAFYDTLTEREGYPKKLKEKLMYRWELSAVAAALMAVGFRSRGALTLQGPQSIGKTTWVGSHVPDPLLRDQTIKLDHHMDAGNKDSQIAAICHWVVEIGELDSSFKKDVARLKGFLTSDRDKVRRPYARVASEYPRRTVFCATVNDRNFLVDNTGNSRWWTIPITAANYQHGIDMQQLFAQLAVDFRNGAQWWLTQEEEQMLEAQNKTHRSVSAIWERVHSALDLDHDRATELPAMKAIEVLIEIGVKNPSNSQCKECAAVLREYLGEPKEFNGFFKWRVPLKQQYSDYLSPASKFGATDDDKY